MSLKQLLGTLARSRTTGPPSSSDRNSFRKLIQKVLEVGLMLKEQPDGSEAWAADALVGSCSYTLWNVAHSISGPHEVRTYLCHLVSICGPFGNMSYSDVLVVSWFAEVALRDIRDMERATKPEKTEQDIPF